MNIYRIDFKKLIILLLPISLRNSVLIAFLKAFISPVETLYHSFTQFRHDTNQKMSYNSQTCYLRKMLNDRFDIQRRIRVEDIKTREHLMVYCEEENKPVMLGTRMVHDIRFITNGGGFIVYAPASLKLKDNEIRAYIDYYKLVTINYTIEYN